VRSSDEGAAESQLLHMLPMHQQRARQRAAPASAPDRETYVVAVRPRLAHALSAVSA